MKPNAKILLLTSLLSLVIGALAIVPIVNSHNGYTAGFVFFPIFILISLVAIVLFFTGIGLIIASKNAGFYILLSSFLLPIGFFGAASISKQFEIGSYKQQPMSPMIPSIANKVIFKKDVTHDEVQAFWREVLSVPVGETGSKTRPGIQSISSNPEENGHEVVTFSFFDSAADEQKDDIRRRIKEYAPIQEFLENVDTSPTIPEIKGDPSKDSKKTVTRKPNTYTFTK